MTNQNILNIAMQQSAFDLNCNKEDFTKTENVVVISSNNKKARKYLELPFFCNLVSYGNNIVASVDKSIEKIVYEYINTYQIEHCFETPNMHILNDKLQQFNMSICFMAEYFLPNIKNIRPLLCNYELKILKPEQFSNLYLKEWGNALCKKRKNLDVLAVGAFEKNKLIGLAGCSADCNTMWQIGVDVLPQYRRKGIASALTSRLACEILKNGKIPFYCAAWSNLKSVRNAIKSGFLPAWVEMTAKSKEFIIQMNKINN